MKHQEKKRAGIWMDHHQAIFMTEENGHFTIKEKIKGEEYTGHKGESFANNAERTINRKYHKAISNHLMEFDEIYLFGPGTSQEELRNFLHEDLHFKNKKITLGTSDRLTDPQMIAQVRDFFN
jgi:stalled ribosome rescue protein Dom34